MNSNDKHIKKIVFRYVIISALVFWGLSSLIFSPLYVLTSSNVLYRNTNLPELFDLLIQVCDILMYSVGLSSVIYSIYRFKISNSVSLIMTYCCASFIRYTVNIVMTIVFDGSISVSEDIVVSMIYFALDALVVFVISLIASTICKRFYDNALATEKANNILGIRNESVRSQIFPFKSIYSKANPLQSSALVAGIILAALKIFSRLLYDIYIGLPTSLSDMVWMIVYYVSDVLICAIVYLVSLLIFTKIDKKEE